MKGSVIAAVKAAEQVHVIGVAGQEGRAVFDYLIDKGIAVIGHENAPKEEFISRFLSFSDAYGKDEAEAMAEKFVSSGRMKFSGDYLSGINDGDVVVFPQAYRRYPVNDALIERVDTGKVTAFQAIELAFDIAPCLTIGVTGTAGKSTTVSFIRNMIAASGRDFYFSGNDRDNKWDFTELENVGYLGIALFEISHRHLMDLDVSPDVAVITNIYSHHIDDAGSFDNYAELKKNLIRFQSASGKAVVNWNLLSTGMITDETTSADILSFGGPAGLSAGYVADGGIYTDINEKEVRVADVSELPFSGEHNIMNALAACVAAFTADIPEKAVISGLMDWKPLKYRLETVYEGNGIRVINDAKSSDPLATIEAIRAVKNISVLLIGGVREGIKAGDFIPLGEEILEQGIKNIVIFGRSREDAVRDLEVALGTAGVNIVSVPHYKEAFDKAFDLGKSGAILFSPACQSFDEFKDYRERGKAWNAAIAERTGY